MLLPEAAHILNNTWHSTIRNVPFTVFLAVSHNSLVQKLVACNQMMISIYLFNHTTRAYANVDTDEDKVEVKADMFTAWYSSVRAA